MAVNKSRYMEVVQANEFVQHSRHQLSITEQKVILFLISKIKKDDTEFKLNEIDLVEFMEVCGIEKGGSQYKQVKDTIQGLHDQSWWIDTGRYQTLCSWVQKARIDTKTGKMEIQLDDTLAPYLLQLKENFTKFQLIYCLGFKSKFSIRLYEYICSVHYSKTLPYHFNLTVAQLRDILQCRPNYEWNNVKQKCLDVAVNEINELSDKNIIYQLVRERRRIVEIKFIICEKSQDGIQDVDFQINCILDHEGKKMLELEEKVRQIDEQYG